MENYDNTLEIALSWHNAGKAVALATVIETWGSAPRPVGSQLVISSNAEMMGSVSGGCVEGAVVEEALEVLESGKCRLLEYGVADEEAFAVGLACGGKIRILLEPLGVGQGPEIAMLETVLQHKKALEPVAVAVDPDSFERRILLAGSPLAQARFVSDRSGMEGRWFVIIHNPPLRMVVVGAVHIAQPLVQMARLAGFSPVLVDPRSAFAADIRFPDETVLESWPDKALESLNLDARTAVITLSHDPKIDDPAIKVALASPVFYLGCLGSRRTHAKRVSRLKAAGIPPGTIARIHAPVGADIGAKTPAEIAISIMAEVIDRLRNPDQRL